MEKSWEQVLAVLAIVKSGGAYLPVDSNNPAQRIEQLLELGEVNQLITQECFYETVVDTGWDGKYLCHVVATADLSGEVVSAPDCTANQKDLAYVIFTSGSTGTPKGVMIDHRGAVNTIDSMNDDFSVTAKDRILGLSALNFDLSVYDIFGPLSVGGTLVLPEAELAKDVAHWHELVEENQVSLWNTVPALMQLYVDHLEMNSLPMSPVLRQVLMSGDWIPLSLPERIKTLSPKAQVCSLGGATEASIWSITYPIEHVDDGWCSIPYGKPMRNQTFHVLRNFEDCPDLVAGELYIGGIGVARGYWKEEQRTNESFIKNPHNGELLYRTGDIGRYLPDGNIEFLGREDEQVKVQGYRIELGDIDAAMVRHPIVTESVTVAAGTTNNKRLVNFVVLNMREEPTPDPLKTIVDPVEISIFKLNRPGLRPLSEGIPIYNLPAPRHDMLSGDSLAQQWHCTALAGNASITTMSINTLSELLACAAQYSATGASLPKYFYPSTGSLNAVQLYVSLEADTVEELEAGCYYYDPATHQLARLSDNRPVFESSGSYESSISNEPSMSCALGLHLVLETQAIEPLYGIRAENLGIVESGYLAALLMATAAARQIHLHTSEAPQALSERLQLSDCGRLLVSLSGGQLVEALLSHSVQRDFNGAADEVELPAITVAVRGRIGLNSRQSFRRFEGGKKVSLSAMAILLATAAVSMGDLALDMFIYVKAHRVGSLAEGYYRYCPDHHSLIRVGDGNKEDPHFRYLGVNESTYLHSAFALYLVGKSDDCFTAGIVGQHLLSICFAEQVGLCPVGFFDEQGLSSLWSMNGGQQVVHSFLGGSLDAKQLTRWVEQGADSELGYVGVIQTYLEERLPEFMVPKTIIPLDRMPLTPNGKVNRNALPLPDLTSAESENHIEPKTEYELQLAQLWADVLGLDKVGVQDNFIKRGGNSLSIIQLQTRIRAQLRVDIELRQLYENQTVASQAELIAAFLSESGEKGELLTAADVKAMALQQRIKSYVAGLSDSEVNNLLVQLQKTKREPEEVSL